MSSLLRFLFALLHICLALPCVFALQMHGIVPCAIRNSVVIVGFLLMRRRWGRIWHWKTGQNRQHSSGVTLVVVSNVKRLDRHNSHATPETLKPATAPKTFIFYHYILRPICVFSWLHTLNSSLSRVTATL